MAIIRSLAVGKARKSAGNLTYQTVKGRTIAREKPAFVANPNTPRQQAQRAKMRNLVAAWRAWFSLLKSYFTVIDGYGSAYNQFVKMNMPLADTPWISEDDDLVRKAGTVLSNGKYPVRSLIPNGSSILVQDLQLRSEAEVGDRFIAIDLGDEPEGFPTIEEYVLTENDISDIRDGSSVDTELALSNNVAWLFYSSARRTSSSAIIPA